MSVLSALLANTLLKNKFTSALLNNIIFAVLISFATLIIDTSSNANSTEVSKILSQEFSNEPIQPIIVNTTLDLEKVQLGRQLFFDKRLSQNNTLSCASCHNLKNGGTDNKKFSQGVNLAEGNINSPSVYNTHFNIAQFWDGRAETLIEQVQHPVHNPIEMNSNWPDIIRKLNKDPGFSAQFIKSYPEGLTSQNLSHAIALFENSLITTKAPFDRYLLGDKEAISAKAKEGYRLFKSFGCPACHQGKNVGSNMFQKMGIMADYFSDRGTPITKADLGRYNVTADEYDKYTFKVPSLRMVVMTAPYFHDGSAQTLKSAINVMAKYQLGRQISNNEIQFIIIFLSSLLGEHQELIKNEK